MTTKAVTIIHRVGQVAVSHRYENMSAEEIVEHEAKLGKPQPTPLVTMSGPVITAASLTEAVSKSVSTHVRGGTGAR